MRTSLFGVIAAFCMTIFPVYAFAAGAKPDSTSSSKSKYEKTFLKDKSCITAEYKGGFMKLHLCGKKLYAELSKDALGKRMLLASTVSAVSNPEVLPVGHKPVLPLHVRFSMPDSLTVNLCEITPVPDYDKENAAVCNAVRRTTLDTVLESFELFCESPDKEAVVFEMTSFLSGGNEKLGPVKSGTSNHISTKYTHKKGSDSFVSVKAFEDNVSICSSHTYSINADVLGLVSVKKNEPFTVNATRTFLMMPEKVMPSRKADSRIGIFLTSKVKIESGSDVLGAYSVINRWNVTPSDTVAYLAGEKVVPEKPIVFYLDDAFPQQWREAARRDVLRWNSAFEDIGFKDVIQVRDFPSDDPDFDPDNLKYSCIRYVPSTVANAMGPSWVDPESGEIVNASVIVYNDVVGLAGGWRFCQTAQLDPRAREPRMPQDLLEQTMEYVVAHEAGHCLGFMHNMAASAAFPTDSLRSASFTAKNGTTASIMDYARFNYVAQPSDKGVNLDPPFLGPYDRFLVKYAYSFIPDDADATVEEWVDSVCLEPVYRYGKQQISARYDPSAIEEDLGDDPVKSSDYGIANLKYILSHFNEWMDDGSDTDGRLKEERFKQVVNQMNRYLRAVMAQVGGIVLNPVKAGVSSVESVCPVSADRQKQALEWVLGQIGDLSWLSYDSPTRPLAVERRDILAFNTASDLFSTWENVILSSYLAGEDGFSLEDWTETVSGIIFKSRPDRTMMTVQKVYIGSLLSAASKKTSIAKMSLLSSEDDSDVFGGEYSNESGKACPWCSEDAFGPAGYRWQTKVNIKAINNSKEVFFLELQRLGKMLAAKARTAPSKELKAHYLGLCKEISGAK